MFYKNNLNLEITITAQSFCKKEILFCKTRTKEVLLVLVESVSYSTE